MDPITTVAGSTTQTPMVGIGTDPTAGASAVNSAQSSSLSTTPSLTPQQTPSNDPVYEQRIRDLMSAKDKAAHEAQTLQRQYQEAIAKQVELQNQLQTVEAKSTEVVGTAAQTAQAAIDRQKLLEAQVAQLTAENMRAKLLVEKPHLAPYMQFIPATSDEAALKAAVEQFEQIRAQDLDRNRFPNTSTASAAHPATPTNPNPQMQGQIPLPSPDANIMNLYANRQNMAPIVPASNPAQMNPLGATGSPLDAISQLYAEARAKGTTEAFELATKQAAALANSTLSPYRTAS